MGLVHLPAAVLWRALPRVVLQEVRQGPLRRSGYAARQPPCGGTCECGGTEFVPESAVLDTWATSSITPQINRSSAAKYGVDGDFLPMGMRTQAHEIIRTWAFYTIAKSLYHTGNIPWKDIMICGFVLAKPGEKISKSKGNAKLTPQALIETYSADVIRYWAAGARLGTDTYFDQKEMQDASKRTITKVWNSSKFVLSHLTDFDPDYVPAVEVPLDKWLIERTRETVKEAGRLLDQYEIGLARKVIDDLFWKDLCDNYIEIAKERLYEPDVHGAEERKSAQAAIYYCLLNVLKLYSIYVPHLTEYIYQKGLREFVGVPSIHQTLWPEVEAVDEKLIRFGEEIKDAVSLMRKYKSENNLSMRSDVNEFVVDGSREFEGWFQATEKDLYACSHAKQVIFNYTEE